MRGERTLNIFNMFVTLDVSKLSSLSKFFASCREEKGGHATHGEVCGQEDGGAKGLGAATGSSAAHAEDPRL